MTLPKSGFS